MQTHELQVSRASDKLAVLDRPMDRHFWRVLQRRAKRVRGWSAADTAERLGVTRATFKAFQTGKKTPGEMPMVHAKNLDAELSLDAKGQAATNKQAARELVTLICAHGVPRRLHILARPRQCARRGCPVCKENQTRWFVPRMVNQRRHVLTRAQQKEFAARRRRKGKRK